MARRCIVSLTMIDAAHRAKSLPSLVNLLVRAQYRADVYARMLPEWPALVETVERDAKAIEALFYARRGI